MKICIRLMILTFPLLLGCSSQTELIKRYEILFEPLIEDNSNVYYSSGLPLGASDYNDYTIIYNLQPVELLEKDYLRLWILVKNNLNNEILFEPTKEFKLSYYYKNKLITEVFPISPLEILKKIEEAKQIEMISNSIGAALTYLSTSNTKIKSNSGEELEIENKKEKQVNILSNYNNESIKIENWYDMYSNSINTGILRKNTLYSDQSVNGYVYFELPKSKTVESNWAHSQNKNIDLYDFLKKNYKVTLNGKHLLKEVELNFIPLKGE